MKLLLHGPILNLYVYMHEAQYIWFLTTSPSLPMQYSHYCKMYLQTNLQRTLDQYMSEVLNDWDGQISWSFVNSPTKILSIAARSRLEDLGLLWERNKHICTKIEEHRNEAVTITYSLYTVWLANLLLISYVHEWTQFSVVTLGAYSLRVGLPVLAS